MTINCADETLRKSLESGAVRIGILPAWYQPGEQMTEKATAMQWASGWGDENGNAAVMAFVIGSPTTAVGATRSMDAPTWGYPSAECLFAESIDIFSAFDVGVGSADHSFLWNYWSAKTWDFHAHLLDEMP